MVSRALVLCEGLWPLGEPSCHGSPRVAEGLVYTKRQRSSQAFFRKAVCVNHVAKTASPKEDSLTAKAPSGPWPSGGQFLATLASWRFRIGGWRGPPNSAHSAARMALRSPVRSLARMGCPGASVVEHAAAGTACFRAVHASLR